MTNNYNSTVAKKLSKIWKKKREKENSRKKENKKKKKKRKKRKKELRKEKKKELREGKKRVPHLNDEDLRPSDEEVRGPVVRPKMDFHRRDAIQRPAIHGTTDTTNTKTSYAIIVF